MQESDLYEKQATLKRSPLVVHGNAGICIKRILMKKLDDNVYLSNTKRSSGNALWTQGRSAKIILKSLVIISFLVGGILYFHHATAISSSLPFFASIDTMKVSRDTATRPLSEQEIANIIKASASLNTNYITVDTQWDYPTYMLQWINAIRATGHHVWFRIFPNQWENANGTTGLMAPAQYVLSEQKFIQSHPSFFHSGDILDPCPEAEQGLYWQATYGQNWTSNAPNKATSEYNAFLRQTTDVADVALHQNGVTGVITTIRSTNAFFATHPLVLEQSTVHKFGYITIDSYPDQDTQDPNVAASAWLAQLKQIEALRHVPIIIGEMGYSNQLSVDDATQQKVLQAEFSQFQSLPYLVGINYWVGAGSTTAGGYTYILTQKNGVWVARPAAYSLAKFYSIMQVRSVKDGTICFSC